MDRDRLAEWFSRFAEVECGDLPLYDALSRSIAADDDLLELLITAAPGQWRPMLLLAALHDIVLRHPDEAFSRLYPTVGGSMDARTDVMALLRSFVEAHGDDIERLVTTRSTQTNEVNRSCLWFAALRAAAVDLADRPLAIIEVGASAGLNLGFDRYRYDFGDGEHRGRAESAVRLRCEVRSGTPPLDVDLPPIVERFGLDLAPVDLADAVERRWLKACIWSEQPERHERFDAAAGLTIANPPRLVTDDLVDGIGDLIESCPDDAHVVVLNSWVLTYLPRDRRNAYDSVLDLVGSGRNLTRISAEGEGVVDWVPAGVDGPTEHTVVGTTRWRNGERTEERTAVCHPHLAWIDWLAAGCGRPRQPSSEP